METRDMKIEIEFKLTNPREEIAIRTQASRAVHDVATMLSLGDKNGQLMDFEGETIGTWAVTAMEGS
jgi:hypothetical protein